ncbi:6516_t:CDS:2 [Scutellospora calospora]|uniref:6516_t:CDS:1 n=1 Tax=Scutellospora calospora TaxID=85575 RepID=A0ACA9MK72_9GLOM|nr:6516_t:CDS:2 [Scutellospora calospora]
MDISELGQYTSEFLKNLTDDRKSGKTKVINIATFDSYQILYPTPYNLEETIREIVYQIIQDNLSTSVVKAEACVLANLAPNANTGSSYAEVTGYAKNRGQLDIPRKFKSMKKN